MTQQFTIRPRGPFSLEEAANFGFGQRLDPKWDGVLRFAFCVDGYREQVGVEIRQEHVDVACLMHGEADPSVVERQVARVLSLDYDGDAFLEVGRRDPIMGQLQELAPGLRPPLFYSPYEAAAWSIISARRPARQMAEVRRQLSEAHGRIFELAGQRMAALPLPEQLLAVDTFPGLTPEKIKRLHGVSRAANRRSRASRLRVRAKVPHRRVRGSNSDAISRSCAVARPISLGRLGGRQERIAPGVGHCIVTVTIEAIGPDPSPPIR